MSDYLPKEVLAGLEEARKRDLRRRAYKITGGETVRDLTLRTSGLMIMSYKLVLLPLWMAHYTLEEQAYELVVNGQNGRVHGQQQSGVVGKIVSWLRGK